MTKSQIEKLQLKMYEYSKWSSLLVGYASRTIVDASEFCQVRVQEPCPALLDDQFLRRVVTCH